MTPFHRPWGRFLIPWLLLSGFFGLVAAVAVWPEWLDGEAKTPTPDAVAGLVYSLLLFAVPALVARRAGLEIRTLYGDVPPLRRLPRLAVLALPMLGVALVGIYALYAPLSLVFPEATQSWLFEDPFIAYSAGPPYPWLGNLLGFVLLVVAAPVAEEWFFRGLLLRRWSHKWGASGGVLVSSLVFSLGHADLLGAFVFGVFMCALVARHRSLWAPTIVHASGNGLLWCVTALDTHHPIPLLDLESVAQLRSAWWLPALGLLLLLPWAPRFRSRYGPISSWSFTPRPSAAPRPTSPPPAAPTTPSTASTARCGSSPRRTSSLSGPRRARRRPPRG